MAGYLHNDVYDNGVAPLTTIVEKLYICSAQPTTYAEAVSLALGNKATPTITGPTNRVSGGGRQVTVSAITDGTVTATGTATHYALTDDSASKLLVAQALSASQAVTSGNPFTLAALNVGIPAPTV